MILQAQVQQSRVMFTYLWWLMPLVTLSLYISYTDLVHRIIHNKTILLLFFICISILLKNESYISFLISFLVLIVGFFLFLLKVIAAGDIKLLAVLSLAIKPEFMLLSLFTVLALGGLVAIMYLVYGFFTDLQQVRQRGIPYAIPICLGSLLGIAASL